MYTEITLRISPEDAVHEEVLKKEVARSVKVDIDRIKHLEIIRRSVDARQRTVFLNLFVGVWIDRVEEREKVFLPAYKDVFDRPRVIVVGAGPGGLFSALRLIERGYCPVVLERGKCVDKRKGDLGRLYKTGIVDEDSNFGYGEGGAGTFSDGKLFTRSQKRGNVRRILEMLVYFGADKNILIDAHPHIGTDKLPGVIVNIRKAIEAHGGQVYFDTRVTDLLIRDNRIEGVIAGNREFLAKHVILATGHSARDTYKMLHNRNVYMEPKDFAVGFRVEHSQFDIDCMQYHTRTGRGEYLPAAEYNFVTNIAGRGVYSFCMCPGGVVVPAATAPGQQVVNGMSASGRNTPWANSALVTSVGEAELAALNHRGLFAGIEFQEALERKAWEEGGGGLHAPAQALTDFLRGKITRHLPRTSYKPGVTTSPIHAWFPALLAERLQQGITYFGRCARGFVTEQAIVLGVETRTSSPLRIVREKERCVHVGIAGLYPCGEGAGYAGGIVSAAMDGEKCAESVF
ncbi:NAD(P)/FAD-dependent oxidoreductase [Odoribacter lunatus]|uniref:NAD(P)/FAD-dependent oxidoreductase n=1 Tax=Odoribacter lunatus TaxID=2941335 RepID=UPI00203FF458|nr:FAD-binding protein [Odoribacter lunatus]